MKKIYVLFLIFSTILPFANGQLPQDCCLAERLQSAAVFSGVTAGANKPDEVAECSCLEEGEHNTYWVQFDATADFKLSFIIESESGDGDYDFALFQGSCPCASGDLGPAIACDFSTDPNAPPNGPTGMGDPAEFGYPGASQFQPSINLTEGVSYILLIDSKGAPDSFRFTFGAGAQIGQVPDPGPMPLMGPTTLCPEGTGTYSVPPGNFGQLFRWTISPNNGPPINVTSNKLDFTFDNPGNYELCAAFVLDECFLSDPTCVTIEVAPIPTSFEADIFCPPGPYIASNGDEFFGAGVYDLMLESAAGCDSMVTLTLEQGQADIDVRAETFCEGDCFEFEGEIVCAEGVYERIYTNALGCDSIITLNLIKVPLEIEVAGDDTLNCNLTNLTLNAGQTLAGGETSFLWKDGVGDTLVTDSVLLVNGPGIYTIQVTTIVDNDTCVDERDIEIIEDAEPPAEVFAAGGNLFCNQNLVVLQGGTTSDSVAYAWTGPNGFTSNEQNPSVLSPGSYELTVTNLINGCTETAVAIVGDFVPPTAVATADQLLSCTTTSVFLNGSGSSFGPEFSYAWSTNNGIVSSGGTTLNPTVSSVGLYVLTVTNDLSGCTQTASVEVFASPEVTAAIATQVNVLCFGENNGSATAQGGGGDGNFTYAWSNGASGNTADNLNEGSYIVTITDGFGCTATTAVTISQPAVLGANATSTAQTMQGVNDGTAAANPTGGTPGYTYSWSNGLTTATIDGLAPDNYTVTVTDANGCTSAQTVTVNPIECFVEANVAQENVSCNGLADGSATANLINVNEPVTYIWSNDETTQIIGGLIPGSYEVTATDANGCEVVASVTIIEPAALNVNATATDQIISGVDDGTATANPTGGSSPYTYEWSNGETTASITGLPPASYSVTVTDNNGCTETQTVIVSEVECSIALNIDVSNVSCNGLTDGQASALPAGGLAPFTFTWSNGDTTAAIGNLPPGTYDVTVVDAGDCPVAGQVVITEPDELVVTATNVVPVACGDENGTATVEAAGGTPDYTYEWSNGTMTPTAENLAAGIYTISVTDINDCLTTLDVEIVTDSTSDMELPVVVTQDITVELDEDGMAVITSADVDGGSSDNCEIAALSLDISAFSCDQLGANSVTLTVVDLVGNSNSASATVTVVDNSPPVLDECPSNQVLPFCDPVATFTVSATDNCFGGLMTDQTSGLPSGSTFPVGETTVQSFTISDANGNMVSCDFEITVADSILDNGTVSDVSCFGDADGIITTNASGGSPGYTYLWSNDSTGVSINDLPSGSYSLTITDDAGCESVHEYQVEEPVELVADLVNIINETGNNADGAVEVDVSGGVMPYTFSWVDSTGTEIGDMEDIDGLTEGTYQLFVTDANGCVISGAYTIQNTVSTNDPTLNGLIKIYPNPTRGWLIVEFNNLPIEEMDVTLHDVIGQVVVQKAGAAVTGGQYLVDMQELPGGVYLLKLTIGESVVTKRVVRVD